jgi:hypothetical protein
MLRLTQRFSMRSERACASVSLETVEQFGGRGQRANRRAWCQNRLRIGVRADVAKLASGIPTRSIHRLDNACFGQRFDILHKLRLSHLTFLIWPLRRNARLFSPLAHRSFQHPVALLGTKGDERVEEPTVDHGAARYLKESDDLLRNPGAQLGLQMGFYPGLGVVSSKSLGTSGCCQFAAVIRLNPKCVSGASLIDL